MFRVLLTAPLVLLGLALVFRAGTLPTAAAIGEGTSVDLRGVLLPGRESEPRPTARRRLAWEVRKRTSVETLLQPTTVRLDDPRVFDSPFLYFGGDQEFPPLAEAHVTGLRRFVEFGGFVLIDDVAPERGGFDRAVRRLLSRAFPDRRLNRLSATHTIYRSFYLLERPLGRTEGPDYLEVLERSGRVSLVYSRHDLAGAWARDNLGTFLHDVRPGGAQQREYAYRLGVNLVMYALCLDYKDDQVHVPFILRRRGGGRGR
ncbi:MAG: DUF4159 domain-containing protein [Myxococcota bacterium]